MGLQALRAEDVGHAAAGAADRLGEESGRPPTASRRRWREGELDDLLEIQTRMVRLGGASLELEQRVLREAQLLTRLEVRLALLGADLRVARLPCELVGAFDRLRAARE